MVQKKSKFEKSIYKKKMQGDVEGETEKTLGKKTFIKKTYKSTKEKKEKWFRKNLSLRKVPWESYI